MKRRPNTPWYGFLIMLCICTVYFVVPSKTLDGLARVTMLDVGQGDSFLIQSPNGKKMLIDAGPDESVLSELSKVLGPNERSIDVVLATHPDADHIAGLPLIFDRYHVGLFLTTNAASDSAIYKRVMQSLVENNIPALYARHGMTLSFEQGTTFSILFPDRDTSGWETNNASVVGKLQIGSASALFMGDAPSSVESFLLAVMKKDIDADVLKVGHHGSKTSSAEPFLQAVSPTLALISAGINNRYGHPNKEITDRLQKLLIPFISTQDSGAYEIQSDGRRWIWNTK